MSENHSIDRLRQALKRLPGVGPKTAQRMAFHLLERDREADLETIEQAGAYAGLYFVLMGCLSPLDGIGPDELAISRLVLILDEYPVTEVILATNLTVEGQATADYLADQFASREVVISRLARGVPAGGELEYMDSNTLNQAFADRRSIH